MPGISDTRAFQQLLKAAYPGLYVSVFILLEDSALGNKSGMEVYHAKLSGPNMQDVKLEANSPAEVLAEAKGAVRRARRAWEADRVLAYCERESGGLDEETREAMRNDLLAARSVAAFEEFATKCRKQAQQLGQYQHQAV